MALASVAPMRSPSLLWPFLPHMLSSCCDPAGSRGLIVYFIYMDLSAPETALIVLPLQAFLPRPMLHPGAHACELPLQLLTIFRHGQRLWVDCSSQGHELLPISWVIVAAARV